MQRNTTMKPMEKNNMTAIEWLVEKIQQAKPTFKFDSLIREAKEMEKEQHLNTFLAGGKSAFNAAKGRDFTTFEDYYNETYGK